MIKYKIYTDLSILKKRSIYAPLLIPFLGKYWFENDSNRVDKKKYDSFVEQGGEFIEIVQSVEKCDYIVFPLVYNYVHGENREELYFTLVEFVNKYSVYNFPILVFSGHDISNLGIENLPIILFNGALYRSKKSENVFAFPLFFEDFIGEYIVEKNIFRKRKLMPIVGFCGYAPPLNMPLGRNMFVSFLKLFANYLGVMKRKPNWSSHSYRARALIALKTSKKIHKNFIIKSSFAFGSNGLNSGKKNESNFEFRLKYARNIFDSDYTLCVRGIGNNSIRFYETICCGRIPVVVDTDIVLPFEGIINWKELCVWVHEDEIDSIGDKIAEFHNRISDEDFIELQKKLRFIWKEYCSPIGFFKNISLLINS